MKINENAMLMSQEVIKVDGALFVVQNIKLLNEKKQFQVSIDELKSIAKRDLKTAFCSTLSEKDFLFTGYSEVGSKVNYFDINGELVLEVLIDKSLC